MYGFPPRNDTTQPGECAAEIWQATEGKKTCFSEKCAEAADTAGGAGGSGNGNPQAVLTQRLGDFFRLEAAASLNT